MSFCGDVKVLRNSVASAGAFLFPASNLYCSVKPPGTI
jgi:hypothetical protein